MIMTASRIRRKETELILTTRILTGRKMIVYRLRFRPQRSNSKIPDAFMLFPYSAPDKVHCKLDFNTNITKVDVAILLISFDGQNWIISKLN